MEDFSNKDDFQPFDVNKKLIEYYGKELDGRPRFRLVWAENQFEKRLGTFKEFYGNIFIRSFSGVQEVPKYAWIKGRWVLERLIHIGISSEIVSATNGSYEPCWVFSDKDGNYLTPHWWAVDFIIKSLMNRRIIRNEKMDKSDNDEKRRKDKLVFRDILDDDAFYGKLSAGEGVSFSNPWMIQTKEKTHNRKKANEILKVTNV